MLEHGEEFMRQYSALHDGVGVAELSRSQIELTGDDRASFLHNLCTNAVRNLPAGSGCEAFLLNAQGKILGLVYLLAGERSIVLDTVAGQNEFLLRHLDRYLIRDKVELADRTAAWTVLLVAGKRAGEVLQTITGAAPPSGQFRHQAIAALGTSTSVCRVDFTGPECFFVRVARDREAEVWARLLAAGAVACEPAVIDAARVEQGTPLLGVDVSEKNLPQEVARDDRTINFTKGCYIGQETVARIDALGHVNKTLRGVRFDPTARPQPGDALTHDGQPAAEVTSVVWSPKLQAPLGLAYIKRGHQSVGTQLTTATFAAQVVALPV